MDQKVFRKREKITPERARVLLSKDYPKNRRIIISRVLEYASDIKSGKWDSNIGDPIRISDTGYLLDGQHRLSAVVEAKRPVWFDVIYGLPEESFVRIDNGMKRQTAGFLDEGMKNKTIITALATLAISTEQSTFSISTVLSSNGAFRIVNVGKSTRYVRASREMILSYIREHANQLQYYATRGKALRAFLGIGAPTSYAYFIYLMHHLGEVSRLEDYLTEMVNPDSVNKAVNSTRRLVTKELLSTKNSGKGKFHTIAVLYEGYQNYLKDQAFRTAHIEKTMKKLEEMKTTRGGRP